MDGSEDDERNDTGDLGQPGPPQLPATCEPAVGGWLQLASVGSHCRLALVGSKTGFAAVTCNLRTCRLAGAGWVALDNNRSRLMIEAE